MVCENGHWVVGASEVLSPFREGMYDCEKFVIIDVIVSFGQHEDFGEVHARVEVAIGVFLHEDPSRGSKGGISHDKEGFGVVRKGEDRLFQEGFLNF